MKRTTKVAPSSMYKVETDRWTEPFWKACAEHRLTAQKCSHCGTFRMPPGPFCHGCRSQESEWVELSGHGEVYSFSVVDYPVIEAVKDALPYVPAVISLQGAGDIRLISNVVDSDVDAIAIGAPVELVWQDLDDGNAIPRFRLVGTKEEY